MNYRTLMIAGFIVLMVWSAAASAALAGSVEKIKNGAREAVSEIRKEAVRAGRGASGTGRKIKEGAVKAGKEVKVSAVKASAEARKGAKQVGRDIKKAFQETKNAFASEFSGDAPRNSSGH